MLFTFWTNSLVFKNYCLGSFITPPKVFMSFRVPTIASETMGPPQVLEFMGVVLESNPMKGARLPEDKLARIRQLWNPFYNRCSVRLVDLQTRPYRPSTIRLQSTSPGWKVPSAHNKLHLGGKESFLSYQFELGIFQGYILMWKVFAAQWKG